MKKRFSILSVMALVALAAGIFGWEAAEKRKRAAALATELRRQEDRLKWAEAMQRRGYVSKATLTADQLRRDEIRKQLKGMGTIPAKP